MFSHFPDDVQRLVEPFAGSAAIMIADASYSHVQHFWISDAQAPLVEIWEKIINLPKFISRGYARLCHAQLGREREFYDEVRAQFNRSQQLVNFWYRLARCAKAAVRYNANVAFNNTCGNRRKGVRPEK